MPDATNDKRFDHLAAWGLTDDDDLITSTRDYVVYLNSKGDLHWETTIPYDNKIKTDPKYNLASHNSILKDAAILEATPNDDFREAVRNESKRLIGEALVCSFDHDYVGAQNMIAAAEQYLRARGEEAARYWYLRASLVTTAPILAFGCVIWILRSLLFSIFGSTGYWLALAFVAGSIGALLSIVSRSGNLAVGYSAGRKLLDLEGSVRVVAGAFSGVLAALAVKAEIILTAFTHGGHTEMIMILAAAAAGTTERLVTSLISKLDSGDEKGLAQHRPPSKDQSSGQGAPDTKEDATAPNPILKKDRRDEFAAG